MIIICGKTIEEVERDLEMAKAAIATGAPIGVGGATMADVEQAMRGLHEAVGANNAPIDNPNYISPCGCSCYEEEDEDEDVCPECGATYDDGWCGDHCEDCGYNCDEEEEEDEDEIVPPALPAFVKLLRYLGADEDTINKLLN